MNNKPIKIISVHHEDQIANMVSGVFRSITHQTHRLDTLDNLEQEITKEHYDLLIIHNDGHVRFDQETWKDLQYIRPNLAAILISSEENAEIWKQKRNVYLVKEERLVTDLPVALSAFYSRYGEQAEDILLRSNLLLNSLRIVKQGLIILSREGTVLFLNPVAEKILGIEGETDMNISIFDFVNDGEKIWNYFTDQCPQFSEQIEKYQVIVKDFNNRESTQSINISCVDRENLYYLLQFEPGRSIRNGHSGQNEYELIEKFAESIANELLNPVNIISGRLQLLRNGLKEQKQYKKSLVALDKQIERISETMGKLSTFAHLKEDTVPRDVDVNVLLQEILLDPSIARLREMGDISLEYDLAEPPTISGSASHFALLFKIVLEICFNSIGSQGKITIRTGKREKYLNKNWAEVNFILNYSSATFGNETTLQAVMGKKNDVFRLKSIETAIIKHFIHHYKGNYSIINPSPSKEELTLLFPEKAN